MSSLPQIPLAEAEVLLGHIKDLLNSNSLYEAYSIAKLLIAFMEQLVTLPLETELFNLLKALPSIVGIIENHDYNSQIELIEKILQEISGSK